MLNKKCYKDIFFPLKTVICWWFAEFKRNHTDTDDAERLERPDEMTTRKNIKKILYIVLDDPFKVKFHEIPDILKMSKNSIYDILHENSCIRKPFFLCVLCAAQSGTYRPQRVHVTWSNIWKSKAVHETTNVVHNS